MQYVGTQGTSLQLHGVDVTKAGPNLTTVINFPCSLLVAYGMQVISITFAHYLLCLFVSLCASLSLIAICTTVESE
jgi:hypothetical protein